MKRMNFPGRKNERRKVAVEQANSNLKKCIRWKEVYKDSSEYWGDKIKKLQATIENTEAKMMIHNYNQIKPALEYVLSQK
jgi:hypothetical protein